MTTFLLPLSESFYQIVHKHILDIRIRVFQKLYILIVFIR